jgi:hypothetical protein
MTNKELKEKIRIVEISQNSWEEENITLLTTLDNKQIEAVLTPLLEEERASENGEVLYDNETMAHILTEKYPDDICIYYQTPDELAL